MSAKRRIMKAVRRRVPNVERIEVFEEEVDDDDDFSEDVHRDRGREKFMVESDRDKYLVSHRD